MEQEENRKIQVNVEKNSSKFKVLQHFSVFMSSRLISVLITGLGFFVKLVSTRNPKAAELLIKLVTGVLDIKSIVGFSSKAFVGYYLLTGILTSILRLKIVVPYIPNPFKIVYNNIIYKPFYLPIKNIIIKMFGRIFGIQIEIIDKINNTNEIMYMYKINNRNYKVINSIHNNLIADISNETSMMSSKKIELIDKLLYGYRKDPTLLEKVNSYFKGRLVHIYLNKLEVLSKKSEPKLE
jgi:hypothetical protein